MNPILYLVIGIVVGFIVGCLLSREKTVGTIQVDRSQPNEPPYLFLELDHHVEWKEKKSVRLRVLNQNLASRE